MDYNLFIFIKLHIKLVYENINCKCIIFYLSKIIGSGGFFGPLQNKLPFESL